MKTVKYHETQMWVWECPECGDYNDESDDPASQGTVICEGCGGIFVPEQE